MVSPKRSRYILTANHDIIFKILPAMWVLPPAPVLPCDIDLSAPESRTVVGRAIVAAKRRCDIIEQAIRACNKNDGCQELTALAKIARAVEPFNLDGSCSMSTPADSPVTASSYAGSITALVGCGVEGCCCDGTSSFDDDDSDSSSSSDALPSKGSMRTRFMLAGQSARAAETRNEYGRYVCRVVNCTASYRHYSDRNSHERSVHWQAQPFRCNECRQGWQRASFYSVHMHTTHGAPMDTVADRLKCSRCHRTYGTLRGLSEHNEFYHGIKAPSWFDVTKRDN